tara:strand:- start:144 stop:827 length:684 start_codon:yes stop_codon:yes gene_type:complete
MPPKKIKIQSKIDKPQDNKNIIKVEKLNSKEEKPVEEEKPLEEDNTKDKQTISIIKPSKSIKEPIIEKKEPEVKKKEPEVKKKEPEVKKKEPEVKKKEPDVKKSQSIASTPATATKPKIEEAKQTNNTVDMFDEDDLDVRNVMMNYDYTKNKTNPRITKYEMALLIGKRATQIECGATPNIKISPGQSVISIAEEELRQRKIPLIIKRPIGNTFEYWKPAHMEVSMN